MNGATYMRQYEAWLVTDDGKALAWVRGESFDSMNEAWLVGSREARGARFQVRLFTGRVVFDSALHKYEATL